MTARKRTRLVVKYACDVIQGGPKMRPLCLIAHIFKTGLVTVSLGVATMCYKFDEYRVNRCVQRQIASKCAQNHTYVCVLKMWASNVVASFSGHPIVMYALY